MSRQPTFYDEVGGHETFERLVHRFYQGVRGVPELRALFHPRGLAGHAYWAAIKPFHGIVFGGMQRGIAQAAARTDRATERRPDRRTPSEKLVR